MIEQKKTTAFMSVLSCSMSGLLLIFFFISLMISCERSGISEESSTNMISTLHEPAWKSLSGKKLYFGHQSVGYNIIQGLTDLVVKYPQINLTIVESRDQGVFNKPLFAHSTIGENGSPRSKVDDFASLIEQGIGGKTDIAFFKFCYVDITQHSDIETIFSYYKNAMARLKKQYPKMIFVHVTVPLTTNLGIKDSVKNVIKKMLGRPVRSPRDNIKRNQFNEMLLRHYGSQEPIFDLAKIESTRLDGTRETFTEDGSSYYSLVPQYTDDGGHLNKRGQKIVAEHLLVLLRELSY